MKIRSRVMIEELGSSPRLKSLMQERHRFGSLSRPAHVARRRPASESSHSRAAEAATAEGDRRESCM